MAGGKRAAGIAETIGKGVRERMARAQGLQARRFELKYIIDEVKASEVTSFMRGYVEPDSFFDPTTQKYGYSVRSLYMDTPALTLKRQTDEGHKNRFKLRIRFYDDKEESPVFLEIKRRENDVIRKERAGVTRAGVQRLLEGARPKESQLLRHDTKTISAMENFYGLCQRIGAVPSLFVVYMREAYVSPDSDDLRITFDRQIESRRYQPGQVLQMPSMGLQPEIEGAVLEIKFTDRFPCWTRDMVQMLGLARSSLPKYCKCVEVEKEQGVYPFAPGRGILL